MGRQCDGQEQWARPFCELKFDVYLSSYSTTQSSQSQLSANMVRYFALLSSRARCSKIINEQGSTLDDPGGIAISTHLQPSQNAREKLNPRPRALIRSHHQTDRVAASDLDSFQQNFVFLPPFRPPLDPASPWLAE